MQSHQQVIDTIMKFHYQKKPKYVKRMTTGICNEVYKIGIESNCFILRMSAEIKYLMGSHEHIPKFKALKINVPDILREDYRKKLVPLAYQILSNIEGKDLGDVIQTLTSEQLIALAKEIASIFRRVQTISSSNKYGVVYGGDEKEVCNTWTERMRQVIDESKNRGRKTRVMDDAMLLLAENLYTKYQVYFDSIKPLTYYGDICSKNVMINHGVFSGLVDLDALNQGDPLEAVGRIKLSWYGTPYGELYTDTLMDELKLNETERKIVLVYALLNQISWSCENGIQFNENTRAFVDKKKAQEDKKLINKIANELKRQGAL